MSDENTFRDRLAGFESEFETRMKELLADGYELNLSQYKVLVDITRVFASLPSLAHCKIEHIGLEKEDLHGGITVTVSYLDLDGDLLKEFGNAIMGTSGVDIDVKINNSLSISVGVPNVYRKVKD